MTKAKRKSAASAPIKMDSKKIDATLAKLKRAAAHLRQVTTLQKNQVLKRLCDLLISNQVDILKANNRDLMSLPKSTPAALKDRLTLNPQRLEGIKNSLMQLASLPDPVGEVVEKRKLPNGLSVQRVRSSLGVILVIYESRPNVALEAFAIGFKAGNALVLRGGKESSHTVGILYQLMQTALTEEGFPSECVWGITNPDRDILKNLLKQRQFIDVVIPRGGDQLIEFVVRESHIPIIKNDRGLCHIYVENDADPQMVIPILLNAKTQRPGVCNAMETVLIHEGGAEKLLPELYVSMQAHGVEMRVCSRSLKILKSKIAPTLKNVKLAIAKDFHTEHLDLILNCKLVSDLDEAIAHIEEFGSKHSEAIITSNAEKARRFQLSVDAAVVYWNASTRFTDGFELGLGGEIGISTQKLHVRGPVGLRDLTSVRWVIDGQGQTRD